MHTCVYTYIHMHMRIYVCIYIYMCLCIYIHTLEFKFIVIHTSIDTDMDMDTGTGIHVSGSFVARVRLALSQVLAKVKKLQEAMPYPQLWADAAGKLEVQHPSSQLTVQQSRWEFPRFRGPIIDPK